MIFVHRNPFLRPIGRPKSSQRRLNYEKIHISLEEVWNMVEEQLAPLRTDSIIVLDALTFKELNPSRMTN
ncbi:hypothetical protein GN958_ATG16234 [Phytophthora infestans]|uniref:Uncharacterized protein n=1 Tax=Phytophthora infestans TaxID=4787 RepID=A0A8S9U0U8_PHYIN|nr:hypothetical protein GN958_ATG16234 [Phytophthora infestans]